MDIDKLAKPFLKNINPYRPGKPIEQVQRERGHAMTFAKLASNENPYPPSERIKQAVIRELEKTNRYPESGAPVLTERLAEFHGVDRSEVFVANGTNEILDLLVRAYVNSNENCVFSELSFVIYKLICLQCGVGGIEVPQREYVHDLPRMAGAVNEHTKIVFLCNPNNPTGTYNTSSQVQAFLERTPDHVLVVMDEAYYDFVTAPDYPRSLELRKRFDRVVVLRTFSKFYSLAGVRIGYAIAHPSVVDILHKMRQPFNVNRLAQVAGVAALEAREELKWVVDETIRERERIRKKVLDLGCSCPSSQANFLFVIPTGFSGDIVGRLEEQGIIVRPMAPFGAPEGSFRVNTGTPDENNRFLGALESTLAKGR